MVAIVNGHGDHVGHFGHGGRGGRWPWTGQDTTRQDRTGQDRTGQNCHLNLTFQVTYD